MEGAPSPSSKSVNSDPQESSKAGEHELQPCSCCVHKFVAPSGYLICGPSQSGKTQLVCEMILQRQHMFSSVPKKIIFVYNCWQEKYDTLMRALQDVITFRTDIPKKDELQALHAEDEHGHILLVIDDKFSQFKKGAMGEHLVELAAVMNHHLFMSTIFISQSLFCGEIQKQIGLNCQYILIFRNPRSQQQVKILGSQIFGAGGAPHFIDAYKKAVLRPHGFILLDLHPSTEEKMRLKSGILPQEELIVYQPGN